jgi:hypothetical protein
MLVRNLAIASALLIAQACTALPAARAQSGGQSCASAGPEALQLADAEPTAARQSLEFAPGSATGTLTVVGSRVVSGPCEAELRAFILDNLYLPGGRVLARSPSGTGLVAQSGASIEDRALWADDPHPDVRDGQFVMAFQVNFRRDAAGLTTDYVGLWRTGARSVVQAFSKLPDGRFTEPRPVLTSRLPLRSVTYFPAPDSRSGRLGLVQDGPAGETRLISLDWSHPNMFG